MTTFTPIVSALLAAFLASLVEVVEAFTIVLAAALTQGWRPAAAGTVLALLVLAVLVAVLGPLLDLVPLGFLQFVIGALLILFGLRWLRKAILRAAGYLPLHDEDKAFAHEKDVLSHPSRNSNAHWQAGLAAFTGVLVEGIEVVFIVLAVGAGRGMVGWASIGAGIAVLVVLVFGAIVHRPLSMVPENVLKFVVGLMLTSFGVFWTGEGLGATWPGADLSLLAILVVLAVFSLGAVQYLRGVRKPQFRVVK